MIKGKIDPHVHCRDGAQSYKETIRHVFEIAKSQGVENIFDMPNTSPPILFEKDVKERLKLVPEEKKGNYFLYVGASAEVRQLEEAVSCYNKFSEVIGIKLYAGQSVGDLAVIEEEKQQKIYKTLADLNYKGVIAVHCEKEAYIKPEIWDPSDPTTHSLSRPKSSEIESIKDQIRFAIEAKFNGILHICHVSCPESVDLIENARRENKIKITCGVTPHHILWDIRMLRGPYGLLYKMNPPLRDENDIEFLRQYLKEEKIDWIETDHAPHAIGEKLFTPHMSGYPSLYLYKKFVNEFMPSLGISKEQIENLTQNNIIKTFGDKLQ